MPSARPATAVLALAALLLVAGLTPVAAAPQAERWPRWEAHAERDLRRIDHGAWQDFLQRNLRTKHPSGVHRMDYANASRTDRLLLRRYIAQLATLPISSYGRKEQKAYWINLYNALTVQVVLEHYPVESIVDIDISPGLFARGPWGAKLVEVEGTALSLDDIEHRILRPIWRDPRVHYAVNCASIGCPNLAPVAYTRDNMEQLLEQGARDYVNHPRGARFDGEQLVVSSIYDWFQADFGGDEAGVLRHLRRYAAPGLAERLAAYRGDLDDEYDWALNAP